VTRKSLTLDDIEKLKSHYALRTLLYANRAVLWLNGKSWGSAIVLLDRATTSSYRLSIVTMSLCAAVWPNFQCNILETVGPGRLSLATDGLFVKVCIDIELAISKPVIPAC